jgi:methylmalonyl-CoA/ethylmalonyl-CoA epimerase
MTTLHFHHTGIACVEIDAEVARFSLLGYVPESKPFSDETQGIRGIFLTGPGTRIELLEQLPGSNVLEPWLRSKIRYYHQAYEADALEQAVAALRDGGAIVVRPPSPATAFEGRRVVFLMLPGMLLVELIETAS